MHLFYLFDISIINMAAVGEGTCHSDPNFAVICSFLDKYGQLLGLPEISFANLQSYLEDTKVGA
jgi:remodeling and spacing factor 1